MAFLSLGGAKQAALPGNVLLATAHRWHLREAWQLRVACPSSATLAPLALVIWAWANILRVPRRQTLIALKQPGEQCFYSSRGSLYLYLFSSAKLARSGEDTWLTTSQIYCRELTTPSQNRRSKIFNHLRQSFRNTIKDESSSPLIWSSAIFWGVATWTLQTF